MIETWHVVFLLFYTGLLLLLSVYGAHRYYMAFQYFRTKKKTPQPKGQLENLPPVTIQLPVFNEKYVVERLIESTCAIRYPRNLLQIQVLDDSTDDTQTIAARAVERAQQQGVDIHYIHRSNREGFKAGALENGLKTSTGEFVAVFDADFIPNDDFLEKTIHFFSDDQIGMVQVRWEHLNRNFSLLTKAQSVLLDGHFVIEHTYRHRTGRFFNFNGTAGIWRKITIESAGGWQHDTLTEDMDLSYRAQLEGWKFVYLKDVASPAEIPVEMNAFKSQQHRWAKGSMQTAKKLLPRIWRSELSLKVKLEATFHLTNNLAYLFMVILSLMMPLSVWIRVNSQIDGAYLLDIPIFLLATISVGFFYVACEAELKQPVKNWFKYLPVVLSVGIGLCINNCKAVVEALLGIQSSFKRTPKYNVISDATVTTDNEWKKKTQYHNSRGWQPWVELFFGIYFTGAVIGGMIYHLYLALPFLVLFQFGFLYVSLLSLFQTKRPLRLQHLPAVQS